MLHQTYVTQLVIGTLHKVNVTELANELLHQICVTQLVIGVLHQIDIEQLERECYIEF